MRDRGPNLREPTAIYRESEQRRISIPDETVDIEIQVVFYNSRRLWRPIALL